MTNSATDSSSSNGDKPSKSGILRITLIFGAVALSCLVVYHSAYRFRLLPSYLPYFSSSAAWRKEQAELQKILKGAAMEDKTVIITTLNEAWAANNSMIDVFLESFRIGINTSRLLNHLVIVALDDKAYTRCVELHPHCYDLTTKGTNFSGRAYFMTPVYLKMMWRRINFLRSVLELGFNFIFTDADIMWFRDPFLRFYPDAEFQIACDFFNGNTYDVNNSPNGGFNYVKSSKRTIAFYKFWYTSRLKYPGNHDQDVLNRIKHDPFVSKIGLHLRFLSTAYFGGFCQPSRDLNAVCTMHANCCTGLERKLNHLKAMLDDWRKFKSRPDSKKASGSTTWSFSTRCS